MKTILALILFFFSFTCFGQDSGTFKVAKKNEIVTSKKYSRHGLFFVGVENTFAGKSSPKKIRSYNLRIGTILDINNQNRHIINYGLNFGKSNPNTNYNGFIIGGFISYNYSLAIGPGIVTFPIEFGYKKLFNDLDFANLNQYQLTTGIKVPFHFLTLERIYIKGLNLSFLVKYSYDKNSIYKNNGFYPTFRIDYYF